MNESSNNTSEHYVHIIDSRKNESVKVMGPHSQRAAQKISNGVEINLDHAVFHTEITNSKTY